MACQSSSSRSRTAVSCCDDRLAVDAQILIARAQLLFQRGHAHHEKLVEIRAHDGEKLHALEQLVAGVARLFENARWNSSRLISRLM